MEHWENSSMPKPSQILKKIVWLYYNQKKGDQINFTIKMFHNTTLPTKALMLMVPTIYIVEKTYNEGLTLCLYCKIDRTKF